MNTNHPETDLFEEKTNHSNEFHNGYLWRNFARKLEMDRNAEIMFHGQWAERAQASESALTELNKLAVDLAATKKTLGALIVWLAAELGQHNVEALLAMRHSENDKIHP